ncbi:hypothetical protein FB563_4422 [Streptomyces puniciscabiei]|uniref:Uncharacterized protein n=1 Tax=Streptomyces puniciscabiei TaxID=164348 RepID=A0A542UJV5_9ACTN|nr:hypothetical protein [Streptomyces puniciscabiei]TQK99352.1 hypothetical protein FB563_4422 [Streptomyces puniciscabiei]
MEPPGHAGPGADGGARAAGDRCRNLTGPARQMCYSARYGVRV